MPFDQSSGIASLDSLRSQQVKADSSSAIGDENDVLDLTAAFKEHKDKGEKDKKSADSEITGLMKDSKNGVISDEDFQKRLDDALTKRRHAEYKMNTFDSYLNPSPTSGVDSPVAQPPLGGNDQTSYA